MGKRGYQGYRPSAAGYRKNMQQHADTYFKAGGLAGAATVALGKYAYDKMFKKPINVAKAAMGSNTTRATKNATRPSRPRTRRKAYPKVGDGTGGYGQWTQRYQTATFGKLTPRKIDKLSNDLVILRHQLIGPFNDYGQRYMYNAPDASGNQFLPLMLFELNGTNNYINGSQVTCNPVFQLYQFAAGGTNIGFQPIASQAQTGTAIQTNWVVEKSGHTSTAVSSHPMEQSIHKWSSLDLELWGQTAKPTMYSIYLCQFSEDVLPDTLVSGGQDTYANCTQQNQAEFWQSMVKRFVYSPLAKIDDGFSQKKIKILKQYKVNIDPTMTTESDPDPHVKTMKLFYRFNRKCNFEWRYSNAAAQSIADLTTDADWQQEAGQNSCRVHPNARMFVMVRASNYQRQANFASATNANTPSISWVMRSAHLVNQ